MIDIELVENDVRNLEGDVRRIERRLEGRIPQDDLIGAPKDDIAIEHLRRVQLEPGDVLVLESPEYIPDEGRAHLAALMKHVFPDHKCVIADGDVKVSVFRVGVEAGEGI